MEKHRDRVEELFEDEHLESIKLKKPIAGDVVIGYLGHYMKAKKKRAGRPGRRVDVDW